MFSTSERTSPSASPPLPGVPADRDRNSSRRHRIVSRIDTEAALQQIGAEATLHDVVATAAVQRVIPGAAREEVGVSIARKLVVEGRSGEVLDIHQNIALAIAASVECACGERDGHGSRRCLVAGGIGAGAAVDPVGTRTADQLVIAVEAPERVVARTADDDVRCRRAGDGVVAVSPPLMAVMPVSSVVLKSSVWLVQSPWMSRRACRPPRTLQRFRHSCRQARSPGCRPWPARCHSPRRRRRYRSRD